MNLPQPPKFDVPAAELSGAAAAALEGEQRIGLLGAALEVMEAVSWLRRVRNRLRSANAQHPLPEGALDLDLDLIGCVKTLERVQKELSELAQNPLRPLVPGAASSGGAKVRTSNVEPPAAGVSATGAPGRKAAA